MEVIIKGVRITLTTDQVALIEKHEQELKQSYNSFHKILKLFGFKAIKGQKGIYQKDGWYAEIIKRDNYQEVWMTGRGLKDIGSFPGGWMYSSPKEIADELTKALENN